MSLNPDHQRAFIYNISRTSPSKRKWEGLEEMFIYKEFFVDQSKLMQREN